MLVVVSVSAAIAVDDLAFRRVLDGGVVRGRLRLVEVGMPEPVGEDRQQPQQHEQTNRPRTGRSGAMRHVRKLLQLKATRS
jgi:hypothetical protein